MVPVEVVGVRTHLADDEIVVLLLDPDAALLVPILIGPAEASAIASAQAGIVPPRPMTHDLLRDALVAAGAPVDHVEINRLEDGVFHAALVLSSGRHVDARASDAIAVALRFGCDVLCSAEVVALAGVEIRPAASEEDMAQFREFLDHVSAEDFEIGPDPGPEGGARGG
ncbi:bifunctional nuclease family protein [Cellulomonas sp. zg-ZUI222]|uniref:Bifunctional nuclease family protein n=1 Tax=Cellulomonas wangleii TaxID=2816956 RepID=A0ABX8DBV7_9CELL|nr:MULTISPECIES: bifunctional nuclease family protein [Cellulomonas]MBO0900317.1 bifunctional nuclease family protein [Cellulomonas sp. zg-ZUI22]MBO0920769.1 bifunctional nuclease family protein [Cellulomonas wangleii]MBO0926636.1 bifunctional nuclease family protein [Cellulomonas wangleii]QVI64211.1 bifunctional nuclease family protein [Cellulomonas wangleii]